LLRAAAFAVTASCRKEFGRSPTRAEWEILLRDAVQPIESVEWSSTNSVASDIHSRPTAVRISADQAATGRDNAS
jgi:hypothetical protein